MVQSKLDGYTEQLATWLKADAHRGKRDRRTVKLMYEESSRRRVTKAAMAA